MREHGDAIEADFERFYRLDITRVGSRRLTWRKLGVLIRQLPTDSRLAYEIGGEQVRWGVAEHLLATVIDGQRAQMHQLATHRAVDARKSRPPRPKPVPRPGDRPARGRTALTPVEIRRRLLEQRKRTVRR